MSTSLSDRVSGLRRRPRPASSTREPSPPNGFEFGRSPSGRAARTTRIGFRVVLGLTLALLVVNVGQNIVAAHRTTAASAAAGVDADAARAVAGMFAGDYLLHDPLGPPTAGQEALRRDVAAGGDPTRMAFTGTAYLGADLVIPGAVIPVDATHAVVAVQARVTIGMPGSADAGTPVPAATTAAVPGRAANTSALPAGYKIVASEWLPLVVPVIQTDTGVLVDVAGPVFSADPVHAVSATTEADPTATEATRSWVRTLFTSYALSSTAGAYLSAPGVDLAGLSGAVTVTDIQTWSLSSAGADGLRTGTGRVGWTFAPTADLTTAQSYTVTVQASDNRWYATALGTAAAPASAN